MYLQEAVIPVLETFVDVINNRLVPMMDIAVFFDFSDPVPIDREMVLKEATELKKSGIISANEARELFNYEAIEGQDELTSAPTAPNAQVVDQAKSILRKRPLLVKRLDAIEKTATALMLAAPKREMNSIFATRAQKETYARAYLKSVDRKAEKVKDALDEVHSAMEKRILETDLDVAGFMDVQREKKLAKDAMTPIMVKLYEDGGQAALDALFQKSSAEHFFTDAVLLSAIEGRVDFFTDSIMETTFDILKAKIVDGVKNGDGVDVIAKSIKDYFNDLSTGRAKTIAQTETNFVLSKATNDAYTQSNIVTGKEWLTVGDDKVREEHVENDGVIVAKGQAFPSGEEYPAEHSVNCRCALLPTV